MSVVISPCPRCKITRSVDYRGCFQLPFLVPKSAEEVVAMFRDCTMDISEDKFPLSIHLLKGVSVAL